MKHSSIICAKKLNDARRNIRPSLPHKNKKMNKETFVHILSHKKRAMKHSSIICAMKLKDARRNIRPFLNHKN